MIRTIMEEKGETVNEMWPAMRKTSENLLKKE